MNDKPWISGWCSPGNPDESHQQCGRYPRSDGKPCSCEHHEIDKLNPFVETGWFLDCTRCSETAFSDAGPREAMVEFYNEGWRVQDFEGKPYLHCPMCSGVVTP